jgi:hypothetical protein
MDNIIFVSKSTQDVSAWLKTIIVSFIPFMTFFILFFICEIKLIFILFMLILWFVIIVGGILYSPYKYLLSDTHLIIKRYLGNIKIPFEQIQDIHLFTAIDKKGFYKPFGAIGSFGTLGIFRSNIHKKLYFYTRRDSNWTLIITAKKKYVIAPNDIHLIEAVQKQIAKINSHE